jgi:hypothetical protein
MDDKNVTQEITDESHVVEPIDSFGDEELSAALDVMLAGTQEDLEAPEPETVIPEEAKPGRTAPTEEELEEQRERSNLGRKVAGMKDEISGLKDTILQLNERLANLGKGKSLHEEHDYSDDYPEDEEVDLSTERGLDRALERREQKKALAKQAEQQSYEKQYVSTMTDLLNDIENDKVRNVVKAELIKMGGKFNVRLSNDPSRDCAKNLNGALREIQSNLKKNVFEKEGRVPNVPKGVSGASTVTKGAATLKYELDEYEKAAAKGMSVEDINGALSGESSVSIKPKHERVR